MVLGSGASCACKRTASFLYEVVGVPAAEAGVGLAARTHANEVQEGQVAVVECAVLMVLGVMKVEGDAVEQMPDNYDVPEVTYETQNRIDHPGYRAVQLRHTNHQ